MLRALAASAVQTFALDKLTLGTVPTVGDGPLICAIERGYFRELGLEVELVPFQGVIQMMPLIVRGDLKMIGGTLSASYFNSVARGLPPDRQPGEGPQGENDDDSGDMMFDGADMES